MSGAEGVMMDEYMRIGAWSGGCYMDGVLSIAVGKVADRSERPAS